MKLLVHGVPDTPAMWDPLVDALQLPPSEIKCPALPGFSVPVPDGFDCSKEAYVDWLLSEIERHYKATGPVDLVGHDWGAILVIRAACLKPDMVRSWAVANALPERNYKWHRTARIWQTPLVGEAFMAVSNRRQIASALSQAGLPEVLAWEEARHWNKDMRQAILALYRSARKIADTWAMELDTLPARGMVFWGDDDPFVPVEAAIRFCEEADIPLHRNADTGHWSIVQRAGRFAKLLHAHWA